MTTKRRFGTLALITVAGTLNEIDADELHQHLDQAIEDGDTTSVHLNVARVTTMSSAGFDTLLRARRKARLHGLDFVLGVSYNGAVVRFLAATPAWFSE